MRTSSGCGTDAAKPTRTGGETEMVYTLMTFGHRSGPEGKSPDWIREMIGAMRRIDVELAAPGELVYQQGRADASEARTVRAQVGIPAVVTDGPVHAPRTSLADFWVVGVKAEERAIEIAAQFSRAADAAIEVRRCLHAPPDEVLEQVG
jgi:hypothetical protein